MGGLSPLLFQSLVPFFGFGREYLTSDQFLEFLKKQALSWGTEYSATGKILYKFPYLRACSKSLNIFKLFSFHFYFWFITAEASINWCHAKISCNASGPPDTANALIVLGHFWQSFLVYSNTKVNKLWLRESQWVLSMSLLCGAITLCWGIPSSSGGEEMKSRAK